MRRRIAIGAATGAVLGLLQPALLPAGLLGLALAAAIGGAGAALYSIARR